MGTKESLKRRKDIPDEHVEELVMRAAKLQDEASAATQNSASSNDIEAIAEELDIAPEYVEQAISGWRKEQSDIEAQGKQSRILQRRKRIMRFMIGVSLLGLLGIGITAFTTVSLFGWKGLLGAFLAGVAGLWFLFWLIT